jgi:hypothetical protein
MANSPLRGRLAERFREVNGDHPMTAADDAYVSRQYVTLDDLCRSCHRDADEVRADMLASRLPLPSYLRSDGAEMVPPDLFALVEKAGGPDQLREWFVAHWADPAVGKAEWEAYLSGQYVCLHSVSPTTIQRKDELISALRERAAELRPLLDELDALEPMFTGYDRLRFGGPTSRDVWITGLRESLPR